MDKTGLCLKRFRSYLVVGSIAFPILVTLTLLHQNSIFDLVEVFPKINLSAGTAQNVTTNVLIEGAQNVTAQAGGLKSWNMTGSEVGKAIICNMLLLFTTFLVLFSHSMSLIHCSRILHLMGPFFNLMNLFAKDKVLGQEVQDRLPVALEEKAQKNTTSDVGPKTHSFTDPKNDSYLSASVADDRLLDGLLASTFDEGSCLSRYQSYLYRKSSAHKPSSYIKSKLRAYEQLHSSCGPHTESYDKIMRIGLKSGKNDAATKCKYLIWTASNGLGNRMVTLAAAFLYAVLTDRVLLVKFGTDMVGLFCEPFPDSSWLLPRNFPYWKDQKHIELYENMLENHKTNGSEENLPSFLILNLQHTHDGRDNFFHCDHGQDLLQKVLVLILRSDQYFVPSLFMIPSFRQELNKMFPEKDTVFHHLGRYLFHPSNDAWELISRLYQENLSKVHQRIGLQIRIFNTHRAPHQTVLDEILACTSKHKLLPKLDMRKAVIPALKNQTSKAVLVASLYSEYSEKLRTMYMTKPTLTGEMIKIYQPSHEDRQKSNDNMHNIKAWTEIYLLSLCDALITSPKSTFGYVAQSLGGLKPWILRRAYGEKIPKPPCQLAMSMEPCFHYPPKHDCKTNSIVNITSLFPHMRHCQDVSSGLKLVNDSS